MFFWFSGNEFKQGKVNLYKESLKWKQIVIFGSLFANLFDTYLNYLVKLGY